MNVYLYIAVSTRRPHLNPRVVNVIHAARHSIILQERQRCSLLDRDRRLKGWRRRNRRRSQ